MFIDKLLTSMRMDKPSARSAATGHTGRVNTRAFKHLSPQQLQGLRNLLFCARTIVEGAYSGRHRSPFKGASPEFVDYREYNPGDGLSTIDWKAVARTDRLLIRLFEKHTDMNVNLMVDVSASMAYGGPPKNGGARASTATPAPAFLDHRNLSKLDYALCLAASMAYLIVKQSDKVGLTLFDRRIRRHFPPGGTFAHLYNMLNILERQTAGDRTNVADALRAAFPLCRRKGLLIVLSDLLDDEDDLFSAFNLYRHRGFEIILFHVLHEHERALPPEHTVQFVDAESSAMIHTHTADIRNDYRVRVDAWIGRLRAAARARRIEYHLVETATPYQVALRQYLLRRSRM
jgi:uncharacterized protein (DUF58 family)